MKSSLLYSVSILLGFSWIIFQNNTCNPIALQGTDFLKFYLILLTGFSLTVFLGKFLKINNRKQIVYFLTAIFVLGIIKLIRGIYLGKPVGYLTVILIIQITAILFIKSLYFTKKSK